MTKNKIVLPGDQLSTSEELLSGDGTFEEEGIIRAARVGTYVVDEKHKKATVEPLTSIPVILKNGDIVLGEVRIIKSSMIIVDVLHVIGTNRAISSDTNGTLRISEVSPSYVKDVSDVYAFGDIIRAKVTQVHPSLQLITRDRELGVIRALCEKCRQPLIKKENYLECKNCGNKEKRKIADDYGEYDLNKF